MRTLAFLTAVLTTVTPVLAQQMTPYPGFACKVLASRQPLPGSANVDFRVVRLTFTGNAGAVHRHRFGEILYLLSGSGTSTIANGPATALSTDRAIVVPPNVYHKITPSGSSPLRVLSVQFPARNATSFDPQASGPDRRKP